MPSEIRICVVQPSWGNGNVFAFSQSRIYVISLPWINICYKGKLLWNKLPLAVEGVLDAIPLHWYLKVRNPVHCTEEVCDTGPLGKTMIRRLVSNFTEQSYILVERSMISQTGTTLKGIYGE